MNFSAKHPAVSLAFVGLGRQGQRHLASAEKLRGREDVKLAAVVDIDPRCADLAARFGLPYFADVNELPVDVNACVVATPTCTHLPVGEILLERGIDLLVEKPVAANYAQTQALVRLAEQRGRIFQVGYLERYHPSFASVRPDFSLPAEIVSKRSTRGNSIRSLTDLVRELMIHDLDILATWLDCPPVGAMWSGIRQDEDEIEGTLDLVFSGGHKARLVAQSGARMVVRRTTVRSGVNAWEFEWGNSDAPSWTRTAGATGPNRTEPADDPITMQLRAFIRAVRTRSLPEINGTSALKAMQLAEEAIRALPVAA